MSQTNDSQKQNHCPMYKRIAFRAKRKEELEQLKAKDPKQDATINPYICLGCMWLFDCDSPRFGGCEEYEKAMAVRA
jgi:hypothetical protein